MKRVRYGKPALAKSRTYRRLESLASVTCMDDAIGQLLDLLDQFGVADNTLVIFFSDNGGGGSSDNAPLRGGKARFTHWRRTMDAAAPRGPFRDY